jgi:hypothetical protein
MWIMVAIIGVLSLVAIVTLIVGCKNTTNSSTVSSSTTTKQTPVSTSATTTSQASPTKPTTSLPVSTSSPTPSQTPVSTVVPNLIIDHTNWDWYNNQPSSISEKVSQLKIFFSHASVGANILQGLEGLNSTNSSKYPLVQAGANENPPSTITKGTIYEYYRGNPDWSVKVEDFESYLENGWGSTKINIAMNKFCYVDQKADWTVYRDSMVALEDSYPGIKFIYWTIPLMSQSNANEVLRSQFNQNLRQWLSSQSNRILFDIADIEAYSPEGQIQTFNKEGVIHQQMFAGYTTDGGHLNTSGMNRIATAMYSIFGKICDVFPALTSTK